MNNTTNSWEEELATLTSVMLGGGQFKELSPLKDFIRTLLHDTEIAAREDEKNGCAKEWQEAYDEGKKVAREEIKKMIKETIFFNNIDAKEAKEHILSSLTKE
jgi:hypothetical protein